MTTLEVILALLIGLLAGGLGGLAGIGGSMIMIPGLVILLGYSDASHTEHHLYMAAAMSVNVLVAVPAARRHHKAGAVRLDLLKLLLPSMAAFMVVGVLLSNQFAGDRLRQMLAVFIAAYAILNIHRLLRPKSESRRDDQHTAAPRLLIVGSLAGIVSGLLGLGGGVVLVPLLQIVCRIPLREAIATTLTVMPFTAIIGASLKLATLGSLGLHAGDALILVAAMAPAAIVGGHLGAGLTHTLPLQTVRLVISILMLVIAGRLLLTPTHARTNTATQPRSSLPAKTTGDHRASLGDDPPISV